MRRGTRLAVGLALVILFGLAANNARAATITATMTGTIFALTWSYDPTAGSSLNFTRVNTSSPAYFQGVAS